MTSTASAADRVRRLLLAFALLAVPACQNMLSPSSEPAGAGKEATSGSEPASASPAAHASPEAPPAAATEAEGAAGSSSGGGETGAASPAPPPTGSTGAPASSGGTAGAPTASPAPTSGADTVTLTVGASSDSAPAAAPSSESPEKWFYKSKATAPLGRPGPAGTVVYTNDDLNKFGVPPGEDTSSDEDGTLHADPQLVALQQRAAEKKSKDAAREQALAGLRTQLGNLEAERDRLNRREASLRNPLLPREKATDEEAQREQGLGAAERVEEVRKERQKIEDQITQIQGQIKAFESGR